MHAGPYARGVPCPPAPACRAVLVQASARWPKRSVASDGICPSAAHTSANPTSDHELGNAVDLTHDPANGVDAHAWAEELRVRVDPRVKYVISNRRIWNPSVSPEWRGYSGLNPHEKHAHVSILATAREDCSPWFRSGTTPEEALTMFPAAGFAIVQGEQQRDPSTGLVRFYTWLEDGSVYAWNGAPGPVPNAAGKAAIRADAGGPVRSLLALDDGSFVLVAGEPLEGARWRTYRNIDLDPAHRS